MSDTLVFNTEKAAEQSLEVKKFKPFPLIDENDPILSKPIPLFDFSNPPVDPNEFASNLVESCKVYNGIGLSANQCGFPYRVFVAGYGEQYVAFFNPVLKDSSEKQVHMEEGCLSYPELTIHITRPESVTVEYQDYLGEVKQTQLSGLSARVFLHEFDHMNGIKFTERAKPLALQMSLKKRAKKLAIRKKIFKNAIKQMEKMVS